MKGRNKERNKRQRQERYNENSREERLRAAEREREKQKTQQSVLLLQTIGRAMNCLNDSQSVCEATQSISFAFTAFSLYSIMTQAGDVMQQLPRSANGVSRLSQAALDAKGSSQSQQVRHNGSLDRDHLISQYRNVMESEVARY